MNFHISDIYRFLIAFILLPLSFSCVRDTEGDKNVRTPDFQASEDSLLALIETDPGNVAYIRSLLSRYISTNEYGKVKYWGDKSRNYADETGNTELSGISSVYLALAHLMENNVDSAELYIADTKTVSENDTSSFIALLANDVLAVYAMKKDMDYSTALDYFNKGLSIAREIKDTLNQAVLLCNISHIYLIRKDTLGISYAREGYNLAEIIGKPYITINAGLNLADMYLLDGKYMESIPLSDDIIKASAGQGRNDYMSHALLIKASAYSRMGMREEAKRFFNEAERYLQYAGGDIKTRYFSDYGDFALLYGDAGEAIRSYMRALSEDGCTYEIKLDKYLCLSEAYSAIGDDNAALKYYKMYHRLSDSLAISSKERQFNNLLIRYNEAKYNESIKEKELEVIKANRTIMLSVGILLVVSTILVCMYLLYRKKNNMYHSLVAQHQQYLARENRLREEKLQLRQDMKEDKERELFEKIESLMDIQKAYLDNGMSLDKIAGLCNSNRSYISKVINRFCGMSFTNYVNDKRIKEAIKLLSDPDNDMPLKALSDHLGYNTLSTFYRVFINETGCPPSKYRDEMLKLGEKAVI